MAEERAYWLLVAVLSSTIRLEQALAMRLYHAALDLHARAAPATTIQGDLAQGEVRALGKDGAIGSLAGPMFEADLDTPAGNGRVRFLLTRQGIEAVGAAGDGGAGPGAGLPRSAPN